MINKFIKEKFKAIDIICETRTILQKPQKHENSVVLKLSNKIGMKNELDNINAIKNHLDYLVENLNKEEYHLWQKINNINAEQLYKNHDKNDMTLYEDIESDKRLD